MFYTLLNYLKKTCVQTKVAIINKLNQHSIVEEWRQCPRKDICYLNSQISRLREDTEDIEEFFNENIYGLAALEDYSESEINYRSQSTLDEVLNSHDIAHNHIFNNRERYKNTSPELLNEYFSARRELKEQIERLEKE